MSPELIQAWWKHRRAMQRLEWGNLEEGLQLWREHVSILERVLGADHVATEHARTGLRAVEQDNLIERLSVLRAKAWNAMTEARLKMNETERLRLAREAVEHFRAVLEIELLVLQIQHPDIASTHSTLGAAYANIDEDVLALQHYAQAMQIDLRNAPHHARTNLGNLALFLSNHDLYEQALELYAMLIERYKVALTTQRYFPNNDDDSWHYAEEEHQSDLRVQLAWNSLLMAEILQRLGRDDDAIHQWQEYLHYGESSFNVGHYATNAHYVLGKLHKSKGNFDEALSHLRTALERTERRVSFSSQTERKAHWQFVGSVHGLVAQVLSLQQNHKEAQKHFQRSNEYFWRIGTSRFKAIAFNLGEIGWCLEQLGDIAGAQLNYDRADEIDTMPE
jgi:tetratricopeptide (TPR) repeat protein